MGCGKDCLILIPFKLPQINHFTLSLKWFSSDSDNCPDVRIRPLLHFPHPLRAGPVLLTLLFFPSSFILPSFAWVYIFFSTGQALLSAFSWCSACTSVSGDVFLMYTWSEMYSTSTCYSTILFFLSILYFWMLCKWYCFSKFIFSFLVYISTVGFQIKTLYLVTLLNSLIISIHF